MFNFWVSCVEIVVIVVVFVLFNFYEVLGIYILEFLIYKIWYYNEIFFLSCIREVLLGLVSVFGDLMKLNILFFIFFGFLYWVFLVFIFIFIIVMFVYFLYKR